MYYISRDRKYISTANFDNNGFFYPAMFKIIRLLTFMMAKIIGF